MTSVWRRTKENWNMTPLERLKDRVKIDDNGCWNIGKGGYGSFVLQGKTTMAHRASYILHYGDILEDMVVCHKCDNSNCCNPDHLFIGTQADNVQDMVKKKRHWATVRREEYAKEHGLKEWTGKLYSRKSI